MTRINVKDMKQAIKDINGIDPFNDVMSFFYDESGNCRKFLLTPNGVNSEDSLKGDFVLAGVAFDGKKKEIDITGLHSALEYRSGQKELKFRHLYNHSKDFLSFMKSTRATDFLHWLKDSDLYIHYSAMNNLFYSITDIVDSLWELFPQQIPLFWSIKSSLYDFTHEHADEIITLLYRHNYPNISDCKGFCDEFCEYISSYVDDSEYYPGFFLEMLRQMLKEAGKQSKLVFVQDNEPLMLIKEYYLLYLERCEVFSQCSHLFDEEPTVEKQFQEIELIEDEIVLHNYDFKPSHENIFLQVSDLVAGLLRNMFMFLDSLSLKDMYTILADIDSTQSQNFEIVWDLLSRATGKSPLLIKNANTPKNINDRMEKLRLLTRKPELR